MNNGLQKTAERYLIDLFPPSHSVEYRSGIEHPWEAATLHFNSFVNNEIQEGGPTRIGYTVETGLETVMRGTLTPEGFGNLENLRLRE